MGLKEMKNGRIAMMAMLGIYVQGAVVGGTPVDNWLAHVAFSLGYYHPQQRFWIVCLGLKLSFWTYRRTCPSHERAKPLTSASVTHAYIRVRYRYQIGATTDN